MRDALAKMVPLDQSGEVLPLPEPGRRSRRSPATGVGRGPVRNDREVREEPKAARPGARPGGVRHGGPSRGAWRTGVLGSSARGGIGDRVSRALGGLHVDLGGDHRSAVFLAGSGRGGTTWVSDVINHDREYRFVFEPFHPGKVGACAHFRSKQYLRPDDGREEYLGPARTILTGGLRSAWTDRFHRAFVARRRLIKDIRANLLLGWMATNFPGMPIVLLLRHPCAVAASRLALGWRDNLDETMDQRELVEDFLSPMQAEILATRDPFERHVFVWCIDNFVPLKQFAPGGIHLAFYENFLVRPEEETRRLFSFLGKDPDDHARPTVRRELRRPSPLSRGNPGRSVDSWRRRVGDERLERAVEILSLFGLDRVYARDAMPDPSGARALMDGAPR